MLGDGTIVVLAVALLGVLIVLRVPLFIALAVTGTAGLIAIRGLAGLAQVPLATVGQLQNYALVAAPLYILLGETLAVGNLGRDLFRVAHRWFNRVPGGLGASAVGSSAMFGAMSGVSISSVAVIGRMAVPEMLDRGYRPSFASGSVTASGALAMLIPPSLMFILYSSVTGVSVAALFAGGMVPGLLVAAAMASYVIVRAKMQPDIAPGADERFTWSQRLTVLVSTIPALLLIVGVLGSIYTGLATPTEAAGIGAIAAFLVTGVTRRGFTWTEIKSIFTATLRVSATLLIIVGSAYIFTQLLVVARVTDSVAGFVSTLEVPPHLIVVIIMALLIVLGALVDAASLLLVAAPILVPVIEALGFDPLWFGVLLVVNLEMAVITPPVGLNLYAMKSAVPRLPMSEIIRGVAPYLAIEAGMLIILLFVPELVTWLPGLVESG